MHFNTLEPFRQQMYGCFERSRDALFNVCDALACGSQARSLPELSLSPFFERRWPSVYEALQDGHIDVERLRTVFVRALIQDQPTEEPIWLGLDSSSMERLEAESSPDRGMIYMPNLPHATKPVSVGWQFSTVMLLPEQPSSWVGVLDQRRIGTEHTAIEVSIEQLRAVLLQISGWVIVLADRWYAVGRFVCACCELGCAALIRLNATASCTAPRHPDKRSSAGHPANMARSFRAPAPRRTALPMRSGKALMNTARVWSTPRGKGCISARPQRWMSV